MASNLFGSSFVEWRGWKKEMKTIIYPGTTYFVNAFCVYYFGLYSGLTEKFYLTIESWASVWRLTQE